MHETNKEPSVLLVISSVNLQIINKFVGFDTVHSAGEAHKMKLILNK